MNSDSIVVLRSDYPTGHPFQTLALTGSTTNEQLFNITGASTATVGAPSQTAILGSASPMDPNANQSATFDAFGRPGYPRGTNRPYFTSTSYNGRGFRVRAMGVYNNQANTTNAQTVTLYVTLGNAVSSSKRVITLASGTNPASGAGNFLAEFTGIWDSATQVVLGTFWGTIGNGITSVVTAQTAPTNYVAAAAYTNLSFCASIQFGTSSAASTASLVEFSWESV